MKNLRYRYMYAVGVVLLFSSMALIAMHNQPDDEMDLGKDALGRNQYFVKRSILESVLATFNKIGTESTWALVAIKSKCDDTESRVQCNEAYRQYGIKNNAQSYEEYLRNYIVLNADGSLPENTKKIAMRAIIVHPKEVWVRKTEEFKSKNQLSTSTSSTANNIAQIVEAAEVKNVEMVSTALSMQDIAVFEEDSDNTSSKAVAKNTLVHVCGNIYIDCQYM